MDGGTVRRTCHSCVHAGVWEAVAWAADTLDPVPVSDPVPDPVQDPVQSQDQSQDQDPVLMRSLGM